MIAQVLNNAQATWLITGLGAVGFLVGIAVGIKKLFWDPPAIRPQPLKVVIDKEIEDKFVCKPEFKKFEQYVHTAHHKMNSELQAIVNGSEERNEVLIALEERSKHTATTVDTIARRTEEIEKTKYRDGKDVHERINDVLKAVSILQGAFDQSQRGKFGRP